MTFTHIINLQMHIIIKLKLILSVFISVKSLHDFIEVYRTFILEERHRLLINDINAGRAADKSHGNVS